MRSDDPHSIRNEPHLRPDAAPAHDPSERRAEDVLRRAERSDDAPADSVFEEPDIFDRPVERIEQDWICDRCGYNLRGLTTDRACPECGALPLYRPPPQSGSYALWLREGAARCGENWGWSAAIIAALLGGPFAILTAMLDTQAFASMLFLAVVLGPTVEEAAKIGLTLMIIETRPYWFQRIEQIQTAALGAAFLFAVIENFMYLWVYIPNPSVPLQVWRWTVCVALHVGCTTVAMRTATTAWTEAMQQQRRPRLERNGRWLLLAIIIHGAYNLAVICWETLVP